MLTFDSCFFTSLLKPFQWPYPSIYSLPEELLMILESPLPFIAGIKNSKSEFSAGPRQVIVKGQSNRLVTYYLDENEIECFNFDSSELLVPQFGGLYSKFNKNF
jgi:DENN (AEX-3) domain